MDFPLRPYFSLKTVLQGLGGVGVIYLLIALFIAIVGPSSLRKAEDTLASQKIVLSGNKELKASSEKTKLQPEKSDAKEEKATHAASDVYPKSPLLPAPIDDLSEPARDGQGILPKVAARGLTPFHGYKRPFTKTNKPIIALAIEGFGLSRSQSATLLRSMPRDVSFIISPYATHVKKWAEDSRAAGHEIWLHIHSQDHEYPMKDPGPFGLLREYGLQKTMKAMEHSLASFPGYTGIAMDMDKTFLSSQTILRSVLGDTFKRGVGYFELNSKAPDFFEKLAKDNYAPYAQNTVGGSENLFANIETRANTKGHVVAVISLEEVNLDDFILWVHGLETKGFAFAPLSAIAEGRIQQ